MIRDGMTSLKIADTLGLSPKTIEAHRTNISNKFGGLRMQQIMAAIGTTPI